jgi:mannose-6-phosphate isomerase-like protein (cupin superfamily)
MAALVSLPGEGLALDALGCRLIIRIPAQATDGRISVTELQAPAGFVAPPMRHRHRDMDWQGQVIEGKLAIELDGKTVDVPAGGVVAIPRGVVFRWWNADQQKPLRFTCTYMPGGFEQYFVELVAALGALGRPATRDDMAVVVPPLWKKYGVEVVS